MQHEYKFQLDQLDKLAKDIDTYNSEYFRHTVKKILDDGYRNDHRELYDTLKACRHAIQSINSENANVASAAQRVLESFSHVKKDYRQIVASTKRFDRIRLDSKLNVSSDVEMPKPEILTLSNGLKLEEIRDVKRLIQVGKSLDNCVKKFDEAQDRINDVKINKSSLFSLLSTTGEILALLTIDLKTRTISEFECAERNGQNIFGERVRNGPFGHRANGESVSQGMVSQSDLIEIQNKLDVSADEISEFVRLGAFSRFKKGIPEVDPIQLVDGREIWCWKSENELIIAIDGERNSGRLMNWSRFVRENDYGKFAWDTGKSESMNLGELFEIVLNNPQVLEKICN